jgi:ABC-type transport system substrate-binding protein
VDKLLEEVTTLVDEAERTAAYDKLQQIIYDDYPAVYAFQENEIQVFGSGVQNYQFKPSWNKLLNYYGLYKE